MLVFSVLFVGKLLLRCFQRLDAFLAACRVRGLIIRFGLSLLGFLLSCRDILGAAGLTGFGSTCGVSGRGLVTSELDGDWRSAGGPWAGLLGEGVGGESWALQGLPSARQ